MCVCVGSGGTFPKISEGSGVCWCRFRGQVPEGSGGFRKVPEGCGVCWCTGVGSGGRFRKVPEGCGELWRVLVRFWRQGSEDQEECYARATVAATRSQSLTVIISQLDMMGIMGMIQVLAREFRCGL